MMACGICNVPSPEKYEDEYLCDGGDRDIPVHYDQYNQLSLDTEDTVLEYTDRAGMERVTPSNRVCIYAPRFASVRTVSRPHEEFGTNEAAGLGHLATNGGMNSRLKALRIVKLADKKTASPGDEIEFTIRYDNLGGTEAFHIRIVDNLTPRLQYITDSATSDRAGRLVLQDNGEGSEILVWELDEPLPGKTGGTVTFKAKVR